MKAHNRNRQALEQNYHTIAFTEKQRSWGGDVCIISHVVLPSAFVWYKVPNGLHNVAKFKNSWPP